MRTRHGNHTKGPVKGRAAERRLQAFDLWKGGASYRQVARTTGVSECQAWNDVQAVLHHLDEMEVHAGKEYRRAILERDRGLLLTYYARAIAGDTDAADIVMRVHKELRDLLGVDAPKEIRAEVELGPQATLLWSFDIKARFPPVPVRALAAPAENGGEPDGRSPASVRDADETGAAGDPAAPAGGDVPGAGESGDP